MRKSKEKSGKKGGKGEEKGGGMKEGEINLEKKMTRKKKSGK